MGNLVWFDFENTPHVWTLKEIISALKSEGFETIITSKNSSAIIDLSKYLNIQIDYVKQSKIYKSKYGKFYGVIYRALSLANYIYKNNLKPALAISHGSRAQALAAFLTKVPVISLDDYEYSYKFFNIFINSLLTPFPIPKKEWGIFNKKVVHYPGLKEELYLWNEKNYSENKIEGISSEKINVVFRPEGRLTHYRSKKSRELQDCLIKFLSNVKNVHIILLARDKIQEAEIKNAFHEMNISYSIPRNILNGPAMIFNSDLVIGGGGTMTREAAVLNTPAYSFFGGKLGHADKYLIENKKLVLLKEYDDLTKIKFEKKKKIKIEVKKDTFNFVVRYIKESLIRKL